MSNNKKWRKSLVAALAAGALAVGGTSVATAKDVEVIGPATDFHNSFWSFFDSLFSGNDDEQREERELSPRQQEREERREQRERENLEKDLPLPPSAGAAESERDFRSIKHPEQMGDYWQNLESLAVEEEHKPVAKYDRDLFDHWETIGTEATVDDWHDDIPRSCDARRATLIRDGHGLTAEERGCKIHVDRENGGGWTDSYGVPVTKGGDVLVDENDDIVVEYKSDYKPSGFDIDHIVALGDAWDAGADEWNDEELYQTFANDPLNLSLSDASANRSKGAKTVAEYIPPGEFQCEYVERYVAVKAKYDLSVKPEDAAVLNIFGDSCAL